MTKLGLLNAYLTERLMVAVREILEVVEGTVSEYQEEAARTHRENENLRRRLREVGLDTGTNWPAHPLSVSEGRSPLEQQHSEQEWSSGLREELAVNEEVHFCERQREQSCDPGLVLPDYDSAGSLPTAPHVKSDQDDTSSQPPDLYKIQIVSATGAYSPPGVATRVLVSCCCNRVLASWRRGRFH
ncbi:hypothetical protein SKAU_G00287730 [Synaphobranchus kaupii]|uniref:Uncharacterized protein n=1 Tax=Synaphobranchus kaupii TaxID=118154 RepID=A0A9Q1EYD8_SYNKA|nr:hypothetical protein SKAU_G00287730 [Synaphobranchus kaupii]